MMKKSGIYIFLIVLVLGLLMLAEYSKPKEVNWFPSFASHHKIPYGSKVINDILEKNFADNITQVTRPPFEYITNNNDIEGTYFFLNNSIAFDDAELEKLLNWTANGNTLFIASESFADNILDELNFDLGTLYGGSGTDMDHDFYYNLVNPALETKEASKFSKDYYTHFFDEIDTLKTTVLGVVDNKKEIGAKNANFIKVPYENGEIILSTFPKAFTNYFLLEKEINKHYTAGLLSYLDSNRPVYVDNHYKTGKTFYTSPMRIFLSTKELKWAYYIVLIGALFYVIFEGKRKQRAVKVVTPLKNQTLTFTRTIADMYFENGRQKEIAEHKIGFFMDYVRSNFYVNTLEKNDDFYNNVASRSMHTKEETKKLFNYLDSILKKHSINDYELIQLNKTIEQFKAKADGRA